MYLSTSQTLEREKRREEKKQRRFTRRGTTRRGTTTTTRRLLARTQHAQHNTPTGTSVRVASWRGPLEPREQVYCRVGGGRPSRNVVTNLLVQLVPGWHTEGTRGLDWSGLSSVRPGTTGRKGSASTVKPPLPSPYRLTGHWFRPAGRERKETPGLPLLGGTRDPAELVTPEQLLPRNPLPNFYLIKHHQNQRTSTSRKKNAAAGDVPRDDGAYACADE